MLKVRIIPCLDVKEGRVVKGINFVNLQDAGNPVEQAKVYDQQGADELCFLDITASIEKRNIILDIINETAAKCFMPLTVGGGVRSVEDIRKLLYAGADKVSINSSAIKDPNLISEGANNFGTQCIVVAIDAKVSKNINIKSGFEVFSHGGTIPTNIDVVEWAQFIESKGAGEILLTSMDRDGTKSGYDIELLKVITDNTNIPVIASGGVGTLDHLYDGIIKGGASAVLAASIFHYGEYKIKEAKEYLNSKNVSVRL